jgi:hypothetical protein
MKTNVFIIVLLLAVLVLDSVVFWQWYARKLNEPLYDLHPGYVYYYTGKDGQKYTLTVPKLPAIKDAEKKVNK